MVDEMAMGVAARCWTDEATSVIEMVPELASAFAERVQGYLDLIEDAWGIIANAGGGNWRLETPDWNDAAVGWRGRYHALLANGDPSPRRRTDR